MTQLTTSRRADAVKPRRQHFLWDGRIPEGHITVIAGGPSKGKSILGYRIAADADVPTIFVTTEEVEDTVWRPRLAAAGMDLQKAWHHPEVKFSRASEDVDYLAELVERYGAKLMIVDPLSNHLRGASIHRDEQVRSVFEPYMNLMLELGFSMILQVHILRDFPKNAHPQQAVPAGVVSAAKAVYLFGDDPTVGADPNIRVLACAEKFNFGATPASLSFEYATRPIRVYDEKADREVTQEYGYWIPRGESKVTARKLVVMMAPETKERKMDRVAHLLVSLLRDGALPVFEIRRAVESLDPPVSWKTAERVRDEMDLVVLDDEQDARRKLWALPQEMLDVLEEAASDEELEIREVEIPNVPDTFPQDWEDAYGVMDGEDEDYEEDDVEEDGGE